MARDDRWHLVESWLIRLNSSLLQQYRYAKLTANQKPSPSFRNTHLPELTDDSLNSSQCPCKNALCWSTFYTVLDPSSVTEHSGNCALSTVSLLLKVTVNLDRCKSGLWPLRDEQTRLSILESNVE